MTDEIDYLQLGWFDYLEFTELQVGMSDLSAFNVWPTREEPAKYKFNSVYLELS